MTQHDDPDDQGSYEALARKVEELEKSERVQRALYAIADLTGAELAFEEVVERLHSIISGLMYADNFYISLYDRSQDSIRFVYFADVKSVPIDLSMPIPLEDLEFSLTWYLIRMGKPLRGSLDSIARGLPGELKALGAVAKDWLGVPMLQGHQVKGMLVVQSYDESGLYDEEDQALLSFVASQILTLLQRREAHEALESAVEARTLELATANAKLRREVTRRERNERIQRALYHIAEQAGDSGRESDFFRTIHHELKSLLYAENFFIALLTDNNTAIDFAYFSDEYDLFSPGRQLRDGLTEYVLNTEEAALLQRSDIEALEAEGKINQKGRRPFAWLGVPLRCEGKILGVMAVQSYRHDILYKAEDLDLMNFISHQIASSLERKHALSSLREAKDLLEHRVRERTAELEQEIETRKEVEAQLQHEVMHDHLTGLPNRAQLMKRLGELPQPGTERSPEPYAVIFLDVDQFKAINDQYGHDCGDSVLITVAERLVTCIRPPDLAARLAGDEFAILLVNVETRDNAQAVADRIQAAFEQPVSTPMGPLDTTVSMGVAFRTHKTTRAQDMLSIADKAMYQAKNRGRNLYEVVTDMQR